MPYRLVFVPDASAVIKLLAATPQDKIKHKKVLKALSQLENDPKYPALHSHKYDSISGPNGEEIWESYVENKTPAAWRIFWHYGNGPNELTVVVISQHP